MKALLAQLEPAAEPGPDAATVVRVLSEHPDVDLALFPELFIGGYSSADPARVALTRESEELASVGAACREHGTATVVGFTQSLGCDRFANSAACFDTTGELTAVYRKTHLFGEDERSNFDAGDGLALTSLAGVDAGVLICFDLEFPEPARLLARNGARLLITIAANMDPYGPDHLLAGRARALDNRLPHLYVNRTGEIPGLRFAGGSRAIGPDGEVLAEAGDREELLEITIDLNETASGTDVEYLKYVRDDLNVIVHKAVPGGGS